MLKTFWKWYNQHYLLNITIAAGLFLLQLLHLYWLTTDVLFSRLFGLSYFNLEGIWFLFITLVDYTEIPVLLATSLVYINEFRQGRKFKALLYLFLLNSQWLHIFWITDEFVVDQFSGKNTESFLPYWLVWVAIGIDYLELPVIYDTLKKVFEAFKKREYSKIGEIIKEGD